MLKLALLACLVAVAVANTTKPHHNTHVHHTQPPHGVLHFLLIHEAMLMVTTTHCYVMALTKQQKIDVKDPLKLEMLEIQMSALALDTSKQSAWSNYDHYIAIHCHAKPIMELVTP